MLKYVTEFLNLYSYPSDASETVVDTLSEILSRDGGREAIELLVRDYREGVSFREICRKIALVSRDFGSDEYALYLVCFILFSEELKNNYKKCGIDESVFFSTLADLKYKTEECRPIKGRYGIFVPEWFEWHFSMKLFGMKMLQFQLSTAPIDLEIGGKLFKKGAAALFVHIPRSGKRLKHDEVIKDYKRAHEFFRSFLGRSVDLFCCHSWLLYPLNMTMLSPESNIARFASDYKIIDVNYYPDYSETWRLFDKEWRGDVTELPSDTSFRRNYIELIKSGTKTGDALGAFSYDDLNRN